MSEYRSSDGGGLFTDAEEAVETGASEADPVSPVWFPQNMGPRNPRLSRSSSIGGDNSVHLRSQWGVLNGSEFEEIAREDDPPRRPRRTPTAQEIAGPGRRIGSLDFVTTDTFEAIVGLVIVANFTVITYKCTSDNPASCAPLDLALLLFYLFEWSCRIARHGAANFFVDSEAWRCNVADTAVVVVGTFRHVLLPLLAPGIRDGVFWVALAIMTRLFRLLKLARLLSRANLSWTETSWFQWTVAAVIAANAVMMGVETDHPGGMWWWVDQAMLAFFVFEVIARLRMDGLVQFFTDPEERYWNVIDFLIVVFGALDLWAARLAELVSGHEVTGFGKFIMFVRMLRMLRILRLLKLVKTVGPLYSLALGVTQAMQSIFWVLVLTVVMLYAFAILTTRMVGHGLFIKEEGSLPPEVQTMFATIWDSMFTLFGIMNNQYFVEIQPLLELVPTTKPVFVLFTICSSWALLSVMTGVVSDHMMSVREMQAQKDEVAIEERRLQLQKSLRGVFAAADKDGSGTLGKDEYVGLLRSPFHKERIQELTRMPVQDLAMMFEWLDVDRSGEIDFLELLHGCDWLNEPINGKSVLKIGHSARSHCLEIRETVVKLKSEADGLRRKREEDDGELKTLMRELVEARNSVDEAYHRLDEARRSSVAAQDELRAARQGAFAAKGKSSMLDSHGGESAVSSRAAHALSSKPIWARSGEVAA